MNEHITYDFEARYKRLQKHLPAQSDPTLVILKGHLLSEEILDSLIRQFCNDHEAFNSVEIAFYVKIQIAKALIGKEMAGYSVPQEIWKIYESLNSLRNELAHSLESEKLNSKIQRFLAVAHPEKNQSIEATVIAKSLNDAMVHALGYLSCFECFVLTGEFPLEIYA
jgi:hypothetical protein